MSHTMQQLGCESHSITCVSYDNDNDNDLFRLGGLLGLYVDLYVSDSCLMTKHASTAPPQTQYYILHLLNGCSTINSTTVRLLGLLSDFS